MCPYTLENPVILFSSLANGTELTPEWTCHCRHIAFSAPVITPLFFSECFFVHVRARGSEHVCVACALPVCTCLLMVERQEPRARVTGRRVCVSQTQLFLVSPWKVVKWGCCGVLWGSASHTHPQTHVGHVPLVANIRKNKFILYPKPVSNADSRCSFFFEEKIN